MPSQSCSSTTRNQPRTWHPSTATIEEPSSFSFSRPIEKAQRRLALGRCKTSHKSRYHRPKHNTNKSRQRPQTILRNLPMHPQVACTIAPTQTQHKQKAGNGRNDCAEFTHAPTSRVHHRPNTIAPNTTQTKGWQRRNDCAEFTHAPKVACTIAPNTTTQTKAGNNNDCAEFTHPQSRAAPTPQTQTQHKQKPATAATIVRNLPTHKSRTPSPQTQHKQQKLATAATIYPRTHSRARSAQTHTNTKNNPATAATIMRNFRTVVDQIPARKNVLKTSFSKGELGTVRPA